MSDNKNDILHVEGGKPLNGTIKVRGAKNFVSKAMVAALLAPGTSVLKNVPEIRDVHVVSDLLRLHGVDVTVDGANGVVTIDATNVQLADVADVDTLSGSSRIPILFSGPLLHRLGEAFIPRRTWHRARLLHHQHDFRAPGGRERQPGAAGSRT